MSPYGYHFRKRPIWDIPRPTTVRNVIGHLGNVRKVLVLYWCNKMKVLDQPSPPSCVINLRACFSAFRPPPVFEPWLHYPQHNKDRRSRNQFMHLEWLQSAKECSRWNVTSSVNHYWIPYPKYTSINNEKTTNLIGKVCYVFWRICLCVF